MNKEELVELMQENEIAPLKKMGQNFIIDQSIVERMISHADKEDVVLEVGPGLGAITIPLSKRVKKIIAVEMDRKIVKILKDKVDSNVEVIEGDILKGTDVIPQGKYKVFSNTPFYIAPAIIRMFLESTNPPIEMILMTQKEVAQRICAKPPDMNLLALSVQFYADPKVLFRVPRQCFYPVPNVDSSVIRIIVKEKKNGSTFFKVARAGFSRPRAQLLNNLSKGLKLDKVEVEKHLKSIGLDPKIRAERLSVDNWVELSNLLQ
ncbi:MAG: 16S rRNA (adenine(1518)-N(6)/adenine(1519)-N(6))-dimethyltransferase RsmA [Candidatus Pacebacteria bacterium]|nr:16S rRNA (adenine(1518)-N(6)/adenine(1519)-N(6))-dimethyltransferase RsmA [Candidatus Paceibacterota bacterium]